jgi:hypothetical protein
MILFRFFPWRGLDEVLSLTIRQFSGAFEDMNTITRIESGTSYSQPRSLTGQAAHEVAMRMFGKK